MSDNLCHKSSDSVTRFFCQRLAGHEGVHVDQSGAAWTGDGQTSDADFTPYVYPFVNAKPETAITPDTVEQYVATKVPAEPLDIGARFEQYMAGFDNLLATPSDAWNKVVGEQPRENEELSDAVVPIQ